MRRYDADSILWNWARWCWSGEAVGNMERYIPYEDNPQPINVKQAEQVERLHNTLPQHEQMVIIAEYPQRNSLFGGLSAQIRREKARRWVMAVTGMWLLDCEYTRYLELFKELVEREVA